jgi:hypothetical protein
VENGLLLRADLHTLYDLNLLGIQPETLTVQFHPRACAAGYSKFDGQSLLVRCKTPSLPALTRRWNEFTASLQESAP